MILLKILLLALLALAVYSTYEWHKQENRKKKIVIKNVINKQELIQYWIKNMKTIVLHTPPLLLYRPVPVKQVYTGTEFEEVYSHNEIKEYLENRYRYLNYKSFSMKDFESKQALVNHLKDDNYTPYERLIYWYPYKDGLFITGALRLEGTQYITEEQYYTIK